MPEYGQKFRHLHLPDCYCARLASISCSKKTLIKTYLLSMHDAKQRKFRYRRITFGLSDRESIHHQRANPKRTLKCQMGAQRVYSKPWMISVNISQIRELCGALQFPVHMYSAEGRTSKGILIFFRAQIWFNSHGYY